MSLREMDSLLDGGALKFELEGTRAPAISIDDTECIRVTIRDDRNGQLGYVRFSFFEWQDILKTVPRKFQEWQWEKQKGNANERR